MKRSVVLAGYYGFGNTGDEAILASLVAGLRSCDPDVDLAVLSGDPEQSARAHDVAGIHWRDLAGLSDRISRCDLVIIGGGGLFQDHQGVDPSTLLTPRHGEISFYAGPAVLAALARKPVRLHGLGFGPLSSPAAIRMTRGVCDTAAAISVRDAGSRDLLASLGVDAGKVAVTADPAFLLPFGRLAPEDVLSGAGVEPRSPIVGVALRPWSIGVEPEAWEAEVVAALDLFLEKTGGTLLFVPFEKSPWAGENDFDLASRLRQRLQHADRAAALTALRPPSEMAGLLAGCDAVLGMRLHSLIFAAGGGIPAVGIAYDPKVEAFLAGADAAQLSIPIAGLTSRALLERLDAAHARRVELGRKLLLAATRGRRLAQEDLERAGAMVAAPPAAAPITDAVVSLFRDALAGARQAPAAETGGAEIGIEAARAAHRREKALLEQQLGEARQELHRFQGSRLWKAANLYWVARRRLAGLLDRSARRRPAGDWAGPDQMHRVTRSPAPMEPENRHDIVLFPPHGRGSAHPPPDAFLRLAAQGHRVFCVGVASGSASAPIEKLPNVFEVPLKDGADFEGLDRLRRDRGLGATVSVVAPGDWADLADRFSRERAWPTVRDPAEEPDALSRQLALAFPRLSVVVVTFNNAELNRLCLESLFARTEWPNFEVVVVDNASTDATGALLAEAERTRSNLTVLRNAENRGFAAANNQGFAAAQGEYLVALNNDTIVTRGWAAALVRHLAADPRLGLVGPVTNAIGNEARIDVPYSDVRQIPAFAREWVRAHDQETFPIPMLAFFCVALPRRVLDAVGPMDERFAIGMFEDDDFNRRVREKGWEIRCARDAFVHHWQLASFRLLGETAYHEAFEANRRKYAEKWQTGKDAGRVEPHAAGPDAYRSQLDAIVARASASPGAVVFLPSIGWGIHLFQRPHHLARTFARAGWISIFDCSNAHDDVDGFKEIEPNLFLYRGPSGVLERIPSPLLWAFPYNYGQTDAYPRPARVVYDWIDDLSVFPYDRAMLEANHERALSEATVVASVARRLHVLARARRPDALYLPNGVEYERFAAEAPPLSSDLDVDPLREAGRPIAGYYGALAEWFDYDLVDEAARLRPDWSFLLIGPMYDKSLQGRPMLKRPNLRWIGPRDYHLLPGYLALFDVATIPFRINDITTATSPLKLYEYFAGGKPVITTPMPECQSYPEVQIARDAKELAGALDRMREKGRDPEFRRRLRALGRENSWDERVRTVCAALETAIAPAIS